MIPVIFDNPEDEGVDLEFDMGNGMGFKIFLNDKSAQQMINIIQNKLDGRL